MHLLVFYTKQIGTNQVMIKTNQAENKFYCRVKTCTAYDFEERVQQCLIKKFKQRVF